MPNLKIIPPSTLISPPPVISESVRESQRLMASLRGLLWALVIEGIAGLLMITAWIIWHLLRYSITRT